MLTALVLQLIQCIVTPAKNATSETTSEEQDDQQKEKKVNLDTACRLLYIHIKDRYNNVFCTKMFIIIIFSILFSVA